jgi:predicted dehydrogenase
MAQGIRVGIIGAGWPGVKHAEGYRATPGFQVAAVSDLIPSRRKGLAQQAGANVAEHADYEALLSDGNIGAVSIALPNHLHSPVALKALKAGKHVLCETPPTVDASEAKKLAAAAEKAGKVLLFAAQRRFGGAEQASHQAVAKGFAGDVYHARASWMRTRGIPAGTGWYTDKSKSGGGAMIDTGLQVLDLAWHLMGQPRPVSAFAVMPRKLAPQPLPGGATFDVEEAASVIVRFEGDKSLELSTSWAMNQAPQQQGTLCRLHGDKGALEVYTPRGPVMYRSFGPKGEAKETPLKLPKTVLYPAMMRHFKQCIAGAEQPRLGAKDAAVLMAMVDAIYKSAASGKSAEVKA